MSVLQVDQLSKRYGRIDALKDVSLDISAGMVFGLLGPNGSGKTTLLSILLDVVKASHGSYRWFGSSDDHRHRQRIGAILEKPNFIMRMSGRRNLELVAKIKRTPVDRIDEVLDVVGLAGREHDRFKTYSLGMKQRLAIAAALMNDPDVLILDEPTNGLDPTGITEIRNIIRDIAAEGKTIILASHLLDEVQKVCDHFAVLRQGRLIYQGSLAEEFSDLQHYRIGHHDGAALRHAVEQISIIHGLRHEDKERYILEVDRGAPPDDVIRALVQMGIYPTHFEQIHRRLEDRFIDIISDYE